MARFRIKGTGVFTRNKKAIQIVFDGTHRAKTLSEALAKAYKIKIGLFLPDEKTYVYKSLKWWLGKCSDASIIIDKFK